jgi:hypothetical protein
MLFLSCFPVISFLLDFQIIESILLPLPEEVARQANKADIQLQRYLLHRLFCTVNPLVI